MHFVASHNSPPTAMQTTTTPLVVPHSSHTRHHRPYPPHPHPLPPLLTASGSHGPACDCAADATSADVAVATSLTFDQDSDVLTATLFGALDQTRRTITNVMLGNTAGDLCYEVPQASWSCDGSCFCTATVAATTYATACSPTEASIDEERIGFTVYATVAGQDVRDTDKFGQPLDPVETIALSATSSTIVTTRAIVMQAVGVDAGVVTVTVDSITIYPRIVDAGDTDAELQISLTMVMPGDYDIIGDVALQHVGPSATTVDPDATPPAWETTCDGTCSHTITILLATGDLTADPAAECDFSGTTTLTNTMGATAGCYVAGTCTDPFDLDLVLVELHSRDTCNPADDTEALVAPVEAPEDVVNPEEVVTTPGEPTTVSWESTVVLDGVEHESTLSSIKAAVLAPGSECTTDLINDALASEVYDSGATSYTDISAIFTVAPSGLGHDLELSVDSSAVTAQTLYAIATDTEGFASSFSGVFCFVVSREVVLFELPSRRRLVGLQRAALAVPVARRASVDTATARSSAGIGITMTGVDASILEVDLSAGEAAEGGRVFAA